jgi:hypothetical protein
MSGFDPNDPAIVALWDELPLWSALAGERLLEHLPPAVVVARHQAHGLRQIRQPPRQVRLLALPGAIACIGRRGINDRFEPLLREPFPKANLAVLRPQPIRLADVSVMPKPARQQMVGRQRRRGHRVGRDLAELIQPAPLELQRNALRHIERDRRQPRRQNGLGNLHGLDPRDNSRPAPLPHLRQRLREIARRHIKPPRPMEPSVPHDAAQHAASVPARRFDQQRDLGNLRFHPFTPEGTQCRQEKHRPKGLRTTPPPKRKF